MPGVISRYQVRKPLIASPDSTKLQGFGKNWEADLAETLIAWLLMTLTYM